MNEIPPSVVYSTAGNQLFIIDRAIQAQPSKATWVTRHILEVYDHQIIYRVRQRIGRILGVKKIKSIGYHDTVTFIRKYIL